MLDRAAAIAPDNQVVRDGCAASMPSGSAHYKRGLELYDARWHRDTYDKPWDVPVPEWDGKPLDGRLLVYCEQGIGDYVMYALLFSELRRFAKSITIEVNSRIASLFRRSFPDMRVIDRNALAGRTGTQPATRAKVGDGRPLPLLLKSDIENLPNRRGLPHPGAGPGAEAAQHAIRRCFPASG